MCVKGSNGETRREEGRERRERSAGTTGDGTESERARGRENENEREDARVNEQENKEGCTRTAVRTRMPEDRREGTGERARGRGITLEDLPRASVAHTGQPSPFLTTLPFPFFRPCRRAHCGQARDGARE